MLLCNFGANKTSSCSGTSYCCNTGCADIVIVVAMLVVVLDAIVVVVIVINAVSLLR